MALFLIITALLLRIGAAFFSHGYNHIDEHFQVLEPAFGLVHGYSIHFWEWELGARSWIAPGVFSYAIRFFEALGVTDALKLAGCLRAVTGIYSTIGVWFLWLLARELLPRVPALVVLAFFTFWPRFVYFSVHPLSETLCAPLIYAAIYLIWSKARTKTSFSGGLFAAGLLMMLAVFLRLPVLILTFSMAFSLWFLPSKKPLQMFLAGSFVGFTSLGFFDLLTWGHWFQSPIQYLKFNLIEGQAAAQFGRQPWHRYFTAIFRYFQPLAAVILVCGLFISSRIARSKNDRLWIFLFIQFIFFFTIHSLIGHKEDRFIYPVLPLLVLCASPALVKLTHDFKFSRHFALLGIVLFAFAFMQNLERTPWRHHSDIVHVFSKLGKDPRVRGIATEWQHAGYFYLRRKIPYEIKDEKTIMTLATDPQKNPSQINAFYFTVSPSEKRIEEISTAFRVQGLKPPACAQEKAGYDDLRLVICN